MPHVDIDWRNYQRRLGPRPALHEIDFLVEATDFERNCIYEQYHETWNSWGDYSSGYAPLVGTNLCDGEELPCYVHLSFWHINCFVVAFYHGISLLVNHRQIENWLRENVPQAMCYGRHSDANNFHNIQRTLLTSRK